MLKIYEYNRLAGAENQLTLMAAAAPLDNNLFALVGEAENEAAAREQMRARIYAQCPMEFIPGVTRPAYVIDELAPFRRPAGVAFGMIASGDVSEE